MSKSKIKILSIGLLTFLFITATTLSTFCNQAKFINQLTNQSWTGYLYITSMYIILATITALITSYYSSLEKHRDYVSWMTDKPNSKMMFNKYNPLQKTNSEISLTQLQL